MSGTDTATPTTTGTVLAVVVSLALVALLLGQVRTALGPALVGVGGAVAFAASLWLVAVERYRAPAAVVASLLVVPVAVGVVVGTVGTALVFISVYFPVQSATQVPLSSLLILSRIGLVACCVLAVLGVTVGVRNVAGPTSLARYFWLVVKTGVVPLGVAVAAVTGTLLSKVVSGDPGATAGSALAGLSRWLIVPGEGLHLGSFLLLVTLGLLSVRTLLATLPVAELLSGGGAGDERVALARGRLLLVALASLGLSVLGVAADVALGPAGLTRRVGPSVAGLLDGLATAPPVRAVVLAVILVAVVTLVVVALARRAARATLAATIRRVAPFVGGGLVVLAALAFARPVFGRLVGAVAARLPGVVAVQFRGVANSVADFYGPGPVVTMLLAVLVLVMAGTTLLFRLAVGLGYLSRHRVGYALAAGGLFLASVFAGTIRTPTWMVFAGVLGSLFVWDAGEFATTLGEEVGRGARTRGAELVHAGGTLAVGLVGVAAAVGAGRLLTGVRIESSPAATVALVGVLVGVVLLVASLR